MKSIIIGMTGIVIFYTVLGIACHYAENELKAFLAFIMSSFTVILCFLFIRSNILAKFAEQHNGLISVIIIAGIAILVAMVSYSVYRRILDKDKEIE